MQRRQTQDYFRSFSRYTFKGQSVFLPILQPNTLVYIAQTVMAAGIICMRF